MQSQGEVTFLKHHTGNVRGVAFHPSDRYLFCSGAYDGLVNVYSAKKGNLVHTYEIPTVNLVRQINAVRFNQDGSKILATSTARSLVVLDVETGEHIVKYENCAYNGCDRTALNVDQFTSTVAVCTSVHGKGLTLFDLRMPIPVKYVIDLHLGVIRDVMYLHGSWPWGSGEPTILTASTDGTSKVCKRSGECLHTIEVKKTILTVAATPEPFLSAFDDGFSSGLMFGGKDVSSYLPNCGIEETLTQNKNLPIWKIRYNSHGSRLYTVCDGGVVRHYRRCPDHHLFLGNLYKHKSDIEDMDISPFDEYIVTASKDHTVGLMQLGPPSHGCSEYGEFTSF